MFPSTSSTIRFIHRVRGFAHSSVPREALPVPQLPYFIQRNSRGSIPVYTDIRNAGTRYLVLIRNVEGNVNALAGDIKASLFPQGSPEAQRLKLDIVRQRHIVLRGGRWKHHVTNWLKEKGF
ncbi:hypothetical protein BDM02DRAFT_2002662 [Thelephora ganbajun]|uniref:Uncharacterized protein n=1 Tax=Thelephora ganbajun TaxID=370292 RepID=A0ACB6ZIN8_THEGA|nr:hypothetical protein BDM02DRAFT_2002662 [Thelephora ganbajun]